MFVYRLSPPFPFPFLAIFFPNREPGRDPFNQNSNRSDREKRTTSKGGPVFPKLFRLDRTDPLSFGPKFPESLVEWIAPLFTGYAEPVPEAFELPACEIFLANQRREAAR